MARKFLYGLAVFLFWIAVWQGVSMLVAQELLLPSPLTVAQTWGRLLLDPSFWFSALASMLRVTAGYLLGVIGGCILAPLLLYVRPLDRLLSPILRIVRAVPVASFIMLALLWINANFLPVFIVFLMVLPVVCDNVRQGLTQTDRKLVEMAALCGYTRFQIFRKVRMPSLLPYLSAACTAGLGFAWKSGIAAEVICRPGLSIGGAIQAAKIYLETPEMFAWTGTVIVMSILLERILKWNMNIIEKRYRLG